MDAREEWLQWRRSGIGASDVGAILGISPWASPWSVYADKVGITTPDDPTEAMELGLALESAIGTLFTARTGLYVAGEQTWCTHKTEPWMLATVDGFVCETGLNLADSERLDEMLGGLEIKTTSDSPAKWEAEIPPHYQAQCQAQMAVTGMERTWLAVLHASFGLKFRVYTLERNEADIALILDRCRSFWHDHVLTGIPPDADGHPATTEALRHIEGEPGAVREFDDTTSGFVHLLRAAKDDAKAAEARVTDFENRIKAAMGEATEGLYDGQRLVSWRPQCTDRLDAKALRQRMPRLAARYTTTNTSRVLRLSKPKGE